METTNAFQLFVVAAAQLKNYPTETNVNRLQRHLDILLGLTNPPVDVQLFDHFAATEFFAAVSDLLTARDPKIALVQKIVSLMHNLAVNCPNLRDALSSIFHLYSPIIVFLQNFGVSEREPLVAQCLCLLELVTENLQVPYINSQLEGLLQILLLHSCTSAELSIPCLGILSNLCRNNPPIRTHIQRLQNNKQLVTNWLKKLSDPNEHVWLLALSVLALVQRGNWTKKLFSTPTFFFQAISTIPRMLLADDICKKSLGVKLFNDLIELPEVHKEIPRYCDIAPDIKMILQNYIEKKPGSNYVLQYLLTVMKSDIIRPHIQSILMEEKELLEEVLLTSSFWMEEKADSPEGETSDLAIQFLGLLLQEMFEHVPEQYFDTILELLMAQIRLDLDFGSIFIDKHLHKLKSVADLLKVLSKEEALKVKMTQYVTVDLCNATLASLMDNCQLYQNDGDLCGLDVMLLMISVVGNLKDHAPVLEEVIHNLIQCNKFVPFLAEGFVSSSPFRVQRALDASRITNQIANFPRHLLVQNIAKLNSSKWHSTPDMEKTANASTPINNKAQGDISFLIQKMEQGLDLKSMKSSEMMSIYECKIAYMQEKEQQLQEMLDAKTSVLQKAETFLADYKCKHVLREGEALKLRQLLRESEERSECAKEETVLALKNQKEYQQEMGILKERYSSLQLQIEEMREAASEHEHKIYMLKENLGSVQGECTMLSDNNTLLQKHNEALKMKMESLSQDMSTLTRENKQMSKQLKDKETKMNELTQNLKKTADSLAVLEETYDTLKTEEHHLKDKNASLTRDKTKLEQEASSLGILCRQHEASLQEKELKVRNLQEQLVQIYELSSKVRHCKE